MQETIWGELSRSSREALRWAAAMARIRADRDGRPVEGAEADEFDLLVGVMLSHPGDSEARQLLAHVGASAADVLPPEYPVPGKDLERYSAEVPADAPPELTDAADQAVAIAASDLRGRDPVIELRALFGGLLYGSNRAATAFRDLLGRVGLTQAVAGYRAYIDAPSGSGYAAFLARAPPLQRSTGGDPRLQGRHGGHRRRPGRHPRRGRRLRLPARLAKPQASSRRRRSSATGARASPSSWSRCAPGSPQLVAERGGTSAARQDALPFWKQIVQIEFNAWHYVEGDLWASLVEHVFSELRVPGDRDRRELVPSGRSTGSTRSRPSAVSGPTSSVRSQQKKGAQDKAQSELEASRGEREDDARSVSSRAARRRRPRRPDARPARTAARKALLDFADQATDGTAGETLARHRRRARPAPAGRRSLLGAYPWSSDRRASSARRAALARRARSLVLVLAQIDSIPVSRRSSPG